MISPCDILGVVNKALLFPAEPVMRATVESMWTQVLRERPSRPVTLEDEVCVESCMKIMLGYLDDYTHVFDHLRSARRLICWYDAGACGDWPM